MLATNIEQLIGQTPTLALTRFCEGHPILAKLEYYNPAGSVKDRVALSMINDAEARGLLKPGGVIIEPTSGNTGVGLASIGIARGYRVILTMPETMSVERRRLLAAYGAELVLTEGAAGMTGAITRARELADALPGAFVPGQFENPANARIHYETTGPELWRDTMGRIDALVAGVGTGGTLTGTGRYLREQNPDITIFAVEPAASPVLSGGTAGGHGLQGIGAGFVPKLLDISLITEVLTVTVADAYQTGRKLARTEGLLTGPSGAAALWAAAQLAARPDWTDKTIAVILPDNGERYLSTPMYADETP